MIFPTSHPTLLHSDITLKEIPDSDLEQLQQIIDYHPTKKETAREKLDRVQKWFDEQYSITWGIYVEEELAGTVGFYRGFENETGEVGYVTREKFRRRGITSKAIQTVVAYGLEKMLLKSVVAYTSDWNQASINILQKLNFVQIETDHPEYVKFEYRQ